MYVANQGSESDPDNTVSVIDTRRKTLIRTVTTGKGAHGVVASDDGRWVTGQMVVVNGGLNP